MMIPGVRVCCKGVARGHDLLCDDTLLMQLQSELQRRGRTPVKLNHGGKLESVVGFLENPRLNGGKLLADLSLLKSSSLYEFAKDLIARFGTAIGLSAAFTGNAQILSNGSKAARCSELHSVDIVESPALGNGLFEAEFNGSLVQFQARPLTNPNAIQRRGRASLYDDDETQGHDAATNVAHDLITGGIESAIGAVAVDNLVHGSGNITDRLRTIGGELRTPIKSGMLRKVAIGGAAGSLLTAGAGLIVSKLANERREKQRRRGFTDTAAAENRFGQLTPDEERQRALYRVSAAKHRISEDELNRAASSYTKSAALGGLAGSLVGSLKSKAKIGAGIGALAGIGSIAAIRSTLPADQYGQHSPEEHQIERAVPLTAAIIAAVAARKKLKQSVGKATARVGNLWK